MNMFTDTDIKGIKLVCNYLPETHEFEVVVSYKEVIKRKTFKANFEPRFGMDVSDSSESLKIAESLAQQIEVELNI